MGTLSTLFMVLITFCNTTVFFTVLHILERNEGGYLHWGTAALCIMIFAAIITYLMVFINHEYLGEQTWQD
jgi:hypothetical protein